MHRLATPLVRYSAYPLVLVTAVFALVLGVRGTEPYPAVVPVVLVAAAAIVTTLERWWPHAREWQVDRGDRGTDIAHLLGNVAVSQLSIGAYAAVHALRGDTPALWPRTAPLALQILLATALVDLGLYFVHRASHGVGVLWKLHAIHHSSRRLYWVNGQRRHLLHELIEGTPGLIALTALDAPPVVYATAIAIITVHLMFQHANIDYRVGPLRNVFAVAELHRWHHQRLWQDVQGNYGALLSVWDWMFGTALDKTGAAPSDVGMDDEPDLPDDWMGQQLWPFRRRRAPAD